MRSSVTLSVVACALVAASPAASEAKKDDSTGICFRRVSALTAKGVVINRYETVIVRQSSSLAKDIQRVRSVASKRGSIENPDMPANTWIGASISDTTFDSTGDEDCSRLPSVSESGHP
jgi:hypothetical protein